ncbi:MAG TPA: SH3 domain-containing protein [Acidimicrobiia bacterium]|nr:SH3 domain-containing protein [Acidimicrobiia bacterium]
MKRHPIRGFFGGLFLGLGIALLLVVTSQIALGTLTPLVIVVVGVVAGVLWAMFGPARPRRDRSEAAPAPVPMPPPVVEPAAVVEPADSVEAPPAAEAADGGASTAPVPGGEPAPEGEAPAGWRPTHAAPEDGLVTYAGADEGGGENGRLAPGLPVQVVERQEQWARIVCSNGWAAWVDASLLVEQPESSPEAG